MSRERGEVSTPGEPRPLVGLGAALVIVGAAYARAIDGPLLWDDLKLLEQKSAQTLSAPWAYLFTPFWDWSAYQNGSALFYRPIVTFSLALDHAIHGENHVGFHITNLLLHLINVGLVFFICRKYGARMIAAAATAVLWGLLPRLSESVVWVSGRTDLFAATFVFAAVLVWSRKRFLHSALASFFCFLAMLSKEAGAAALAALIVAELWPPWQLRVQMPRVLLHCANLVLYLVLRLSATSSLVQPEYAIELTTPERALTVLEALGRYFWMSIFPWTPQTQIGVVGFPDLRFAVLGVAVGGVLLWVGIRHARRLSPEVAFAAATAAGSLLLVLHILPLPWAATVGDRLLYIPLALVLAILAPAVDDRLRSRRWVKLVAPALAVSFVLPIQQRIDLFSNEVRFWVDAAETTRAENPGPETAVVGLCRRVGMCDEALQLSRLLQGRRWPTGRSLDDVGASCLTWLGQYQRARAALDERFTDYERMAPRDYLEVARAELHLKRLPAARALVQKSLELSPEYADAQQLSRVVGNVEALEAKGEGRTPVEDARLEVFYGRRPEAEAAWLRLFRAGTLRPDEEQEALAFILTTGSIEGGLRALELYQARHGKLPGYVDAFLERKKMAEELGDSFPHILEVFKRKRRELGLEADVGDQDSASP